MIFKSLGMGICLIAINIYYHQIVLSSNRSFEIKIISDDSKLEK